MKIKITDVLPIVNPPEVGERTHGYKKRDRTTKKQTHENVLYRSW